MSRRLALALFATLSAMPACVEEPRVDSASQGIVGGEFVSDGTFPEVAGLDINYGTAEQGRCSGALVAPNLVLTAGHCFFNAQTYLAAEVTRIEAAQSRELTDAELLEVADRVLANPPNEGIDHPTIIRLGTIFMRDNRGESIPSAGFRVHPEYVKTMSTQLLNRLHGIPTTDDRSPYDFTLVWLGQPSRFTPALLGTKGQVQTGMGARAAGFGTIDDEGHLDDRLKTLPVTIEDSACTDAGGECTTGVEMRIRSPLGSEVCFGDSGSPILIDGPGGRVTLGVLSRTDTTNLPDGFTGPLLCDGKLPDVYGRVDVARDWLINNGVPAEPSSGSAGLLGCNSSGPGGLWPLFLLAGLIMRASMRPKGRRSRRSPEIRAPGR